MDPSSSSLFAPGSILSSTGNHIGLILSNTCEQCLGGESIVLNVVTAVPEPASIALVGAGLVALASRRRKKAEGTNATTVA